MKRVEQLHHTFFAGVSVNNAIPSVWHQDLMCFFFSVIVAKSYRLYCPILSRRFAVYLELSFVLSQSRSTQEKYLTKN